MIEPAKIVVDINHWESVWGRYRKLIQAALNDAQGGLTKFRAEDIMRDFERLKGECQGEKYGSIVEQMQALRLREIEREGKHNG